MEAAVSSNYLDETATLGSSTDTGFIAMINNGKINEMPAQGGKLTDAQIHVLAAYVWGLSNKPALAKP